MSALTRAVRDWLEIASSGRARPFLAIALLVDASFLFVFLVVLQTYLPEKYGASASLAGYALAAYGAAKLVTQITGGRFVDRIGARRALRAGLFFIALAQLSLVFAPDRSVLAYPAAIVYGLGAAVVWPALYSLIAAGFAVSERGRLTSALTITSAGAAALGLGLGVVLPGATPYVAALLVALSGTLVTLRLTAGLPSPPPVATAKIEFAGKGAGFWQDSSRIALAAIFLAESAALSALLAVFRAIGRDLFHVSLRVEALYFVPAVAAYGCGLLAGGVASDRIGRWPLLGGGMVAASAAMVAFSFSSGTPAVLLLTLSAGGLGVALPSLNAMSVDLSPEPVRGKLIAWFFAAEGLGHTLGPAAAAVLSSAIGTAAVVRFSGSAFLAAALVCCLAITTGSPARVEVGHGLEASAE
jgi:MFS family permease